MSKSAIGRRAGVPVAAAQWAWSCGFYPGMEPGAHKSGVAESFESARAGFEADWHRILPTLTEASFSECRRNRAFHDWKSRMWESGCKMPTQEPELRSRCFCGTAIDSDTMDRHVFTAHMTA
jgi:hypothetical protein